jgi:SAM-dependent methyltransferase
VTGASGQDTFRARSAPGRAADFYVPGTLDVEQWFRVADVDYLALLRARPPQAFVPSGSRHVRLLDIGCGTGRFPALLRPALDATARITYDAVDPSDHCLRLARDSLRRPYEAGQVWQCGAEELAGIAPSQPYDRIWAMHSLYFLPAPAMAGVLQQLRRLLAPQGRALVYIATRESFYGRAHKAYRQVFSTPLLPFLLAEDWTGACAASGGAWTQQTLHFEHTIAVDDTALLQSYLQKCVLDPSRSLADWLRHDDLRSLLEGAREGALYRFAQAVTLFELAP